MTLNCLFLELHFLQTFDIVMVSIDRECHLVYICVSAVCCVDLTPPSSFAVFRLVHNYLLAQQVVHVLLMNIFMIYG